MLLRMSLYAQGSIIGRGIKVEDPSINGGQPISVDSLQLDAFSLKANGSKELFEDAPNQASFNVGNAVLQGVKINQNGNAISGDIALAGASGAFDSKQSTASVGVKISKPLRLQPVKIH